MSTVKMVLANKTNKQALNEWEDFLQSIRNSTPVDVNESEEDKAKRKKKLEADPEEWFKYYFPKYCSAPPADFQIKSTRRIMRADKRYYQRRAWARGLAKTTRRMMEVLYIKFVKKLRVNALLISKSYDNAERLLDSYMVNLEANQRLINDYGIQEKPGKWSHGEFTTRDGSTFRAVGADQNPRGAKNEELRINVVIFDDVDDDEVCRNPERLEQRWLWIEQAVIPTVDISNIYYIFFDNNIIAEDSLAVRAGKVADDPETINIRDENGVSVWSAKNSEDDIDYMLSIISYESGQKEYFNNPMNAGKTFPEMRWGKCPPLKSLPFVVIYADPATSNKDKPSLKAKAQNSHKAVAVMGSDGFRYFIYTCFLDVVKNSTFIDWMFASILYVKGKTQSFLYVENNTLQDPFYTQVLLPIAYGKKDEYGFSLPISPDERDKPEKWFRIEGNLEPLNRLGQLILNEDEKSNPHMQRLEAQFKAATPNSKRLDGPDAVEGAVHKIKEKLITSKAGEMKTGSRRPHSKRY